jgi:carbon-monoxide dehydrogenase small subunit
MSTLVTLTLDVNGKRRRVRVAPMKRLLDVLREDLELTGSKEGCGEGECGACSVLLDGKSVCSCLVPASQAEGVKIVTVEGLAKGSRLTALQQAFLELGGAQCGICTPGMLVTSVELLERVRGRIPGEDEVREALAGNLCRCTGYQKIVDAVRAAARSARDAGAGASKNGGATTKARAESDGRTRMGRSVDGRSAKRARAARRSRDSRPSGRTASSTQGSKGKRARAKASRS